MNRKVVINRLQTLVPGLDAVLGGGLPEFSFNLIAGQPGCGKTTLAHQIMFALATPERPALYFTVLGEPPLKMLRYQQQFDYFDSAAVNQSVRFISLSDDALSGDFNRVLQRIVSEVVAVGPGLVLVDSFRSVAAAGLQGGSEPGEKPRPQLGLQQFVQQLGVLMTSWQATTFLIGEYDSEDDANPVFTVADGLIWLRQSVQRNSMVRKLEIVKMRGQATLPGLHTFRIDRSGVHVFAPASSLPQPVAVPIGPGARAGTGVAELDAMLGGGVPRGYSLLVAGPSGSGKSTLAASFLAEGARHGETAVLAAFEQRPSRARNPRLADLIERGVLGIIDSREPDLSIDEIVLLILREVQNLGATRVVLDSLSGFELSMAPNFQADFRESLLRLVTTLAASGVTVLLTTELEDRYTDLRFSPYGAAFLTDAIVVQRYIEVDSRLLRAMAVVKVRGSAHSNELRQYHIDDSGIQVGARLGGQAGLLSGRTLRVHADPSPHQAAPLPLRGA
jgi:circadian clock protein KaiC